MIDQIELNIIDIYLEKKPEIFLSIIFEYQIMLKYLIIIKIQKLKKMMIYDMKK
jgi:hypothetical protein